MSSTALVPATAPGRGRAAVVAGIAVALILGAGAGWAVRTLVAPGGDQAPSSYGVATVGLGEVESTLNVAVRAEWEEVQTVAGLAQGVVTAVHADSGSPVAAGEALYSVDLRPTVLGQGEIPAFTDLARGAAGPAVAQLQQFLVDAGFATSSVDGVFGAATERAVRSWQLSLSGPVDGVVRASDIVWVETVPARLRLLALERGTVLGGQEATVAVLAPEPTFAAVLTSAQAGSAVPGTSVRVLGVDGSEAEGVVLEQRSATDTPDAIDALLQLDAATCGQVCLNVAVEGVTYLNGIVVTVPPETGLTLPTGAIRTDAEGRAFVQLLDGSAQEVMVVQSARGVSLIEGLEEGATVRLPGEPG